MQKKYYSIFLVAAVIVVGGWYYFTTANAVEYVAPLEPPVCTSIECEVERRTQHILERDMHEYLEQSRLKALSEINAELSAMTYDSPYINTNAYE